MTRKILPKIKIPEYSLTLPISQTKVQFRPYNVGDERLLLQAQAAKDTDKDFYITNTLNVIRGVVLNDVSIDNSPSIDIKYLLLHLRAKSVGDELAFSYDKENVAVNISDFIVVNERSKDDYKIDIGGGVYLKMKDITFKDEITSSSSSPNEVGAFYQMIIRSVEGIYTEDEAWIVGQDGVTVEDIEEFIVDIPNTESQKLYDFISTSPHLAVQAMIKGKPVDLTSKEVDFLA